MASGVAEIAGGVAVLPDGTRRAARWWLLATLVAVYPANIHMALQPEQFPTDPGGRSGARLPKGSSRSDLARNAFAWMTPGADTRPGLSSRLSSAAGVRLHAQNPGIR